MFLQIVRSYKEINCCQHVIPTINQKEVLSTSLIYISLHITSFQTTLRDSY